MHILPPTLLLSVKVNVPLTLMLFGLIPFKPSTATYCRMHHSYNAAKLISHVDNTVILHVDICTWCGGPVRYQGRTKVRCGPVRSGVAFRWGVQARRNVLRAGGGDFGKGTLKIAQGSTPPLPKKICNLNYREITKIQWTVPEFVRSTVSTA